jgi:hypothetical protein
LIKTHFLTATSSSSCEFNATLVENASLVTFSLAPRAPRFSEVIGDSGLVEKPFQRFRALKPLKRLSDHFDG